MSEFSVKSAGLASAEGGIKECSDKLRQVAAALNDLEGLRKSNYSGIRRSIYAARDKVLDEKTKMTTLETSLHTIAKCYQDSEKRILNEIPANDAVGSATDGAQSTNSPTDVDWLLELSKSGANGFLDVLGEFGQAGEIVSILTALLKIGIDGDGFTAKDMGDIIEGLGNSAIGILEGIDLKEVDWKELFGLNTCPTLEGTPSASFMSTLKGELGLNKAKQGINGMTMAGWAFALIGNGFGNYEEYSEGKITTGRAIAETVVETGIDIGKGALLAAGVAAGAALLGIAAPAVVVGGIAIAASAILDYGCKQLFGKELTETISDFVLDTAGEIGDAIGTAAKEATGAIRSIGKAVTSWLPKLSFSF